MFLRVYRKARNIYSIILLNSLRTVRACDTWTNIIPSFFVPAQWDGNYTPDWYNPEHKDPFPYSSYLEGDVNISHPVPSYPLLRLRGECSQEMGPSLFHLACTCGRRFYLRYSAAEYAGSLITLFQLVWSWIYAKRSKLKRLILPPLNTELQK